MMFILPLAVIGLAIAGAAMSAQPWRVALFFASIAIAVVATVMHLS